MSPDLAISLQNHESGLPSVSVIFPTYNRCDVVLETLLRLCSQKYPADLIQVIVCDNSSDGTVAMVNMVASEAPVNIVLIHNDERLPAVKRNQGLRAATGDIVIFLNDDVWVDDTFIRAHIDAHAKADRTIAVLGHVHQSATMAQTPFIRWYQPFAYQLISDRAGDTVPFWFHWSMNLSFPRDVLLERNLIFHEDWANIGHEDIELGYRWSQAGYDIVYEPTATGEHFHPHTLASACRLQTSVGRGLRDLEVLIPEPDLLEHYGVLSRTGSARSRVRGMVRRTLFNRATVPTLVNLFDRRDPGSRAAQWTYWKLMLFYTESGYRTAPQRSPLRTTTR
jgi:GT2 family glycosyltransferase